MRHHLLCAVLLPAIALSAPAQQPIPCSLITAPISADGYMAILSMIGDSFRDEACH